jgi:DNA replication and repair protein RecF
MSLSRLSIQNVRNIESSSLELGPAVNVVCGDNGSGKTSILESIYFLGSTRSFRSASVEPLINRDADCCLVRGELAGGASLAVERSRSGKRQLRLSGEAVKRTSELARALPVLALGPESVNLLLDGPEQRRKFLNWGVFHVEHSQSFQGLWESGLRSLRQRNHLLRRRRDQRHGISPVKNQESEQELQSWTQSLVTASEAIHSRRERYFTELRQVFLENCRELTEIQEVTLDYEKGWQGGLVETLDADFVQDIKRGYTHKGFQRADVKIRIKGDDVAKVCSRGELKVLSWALIISQGDLLEHEVIYLVDDLMSELDDIHRRRICNHLEDRQRQVVVTGIDSDPLVSFWQSEPRLFHVKHGVIKELKPNE